MGSERNLDVFVIARMLDAILESNGRQSETNVAGAAGVNPETYKHYRDVLLLTGDIEMKTRADGRPTPIITAAGLQTRADAKRTCARFSKENLQLEAKRQHLAGRTRSPSSQEDAQ